MTDITPIWTPDTTSLEDSAIARFARAATATSGRELSSYDDLWRWSVDDLDGFWRAVWDFFDIRADGRVTTALADESMPGAMWFPGTQLNYAEHALRAGEDPGRAQQVAVTAIDESGRRETLTWAQLCDQVASVADWLRSVDVRQGDRVIGYLPNGAPTLVAFLACASIGAIWSACAQDYSGSGAANRFGQLEPVVLFAADGYRWNGTVHDRRAEVATLRESLPTLRHVVEVPNVDLYQANSPSDGASSWAAVSSRPAELTFERVDFDTPLWVLFSSGTTGLPKGIVHSHGGVVLEHHKLLGLQMDCGPQHSLFWYTTTNWMMWNIVASGLLLGSPVVLYDGSPTYPEVDRLWRIAAEEHVSFFGLSPGYLLGCAQADIHPGRDLDLSSLRIVGATGAPVSASSYDWVRDRVGERVQLCSVSGGTDVVAAFASSAPTTPIWPGEIAGPALGVALAAWDDDGKPLVNEVGELVVTRPMPSMPVKFWNDPDGARYRDAYFSTYPGVWRHGDWMTITDRGTVIISGRSDSTLNRHGVRLGSADIYHVVDKMPQIRESLVIGAELDDGEYWLALFVQLADGVELTDDLIAEIKRAIRTEASPRHVPDDVIAVDAIPHTKTGKRLEVPVKRLIQGQPLEKVASRDAVDDYDALAHFEVYRRK